MQLNNQSICVLILAAGKGTRMRSNTPKVLQQIMEEPIISYPLNAVKTAGFDNQDIAVMVGFGGMQVEKYLNSNFSGVNVIWQKEQLGTGHAAKLAQGWWENYDNVMVLTGDTPLITADTLLKFVNEHVSSDDKCSFLSFELDNPKGYGRVIRSGSSISIVEEKDADEKQKLCREVNSGMYIFSTKALSAVIDRIGCENNQKEYYLPDALSLIEGDGGSLNAIKAENPQDFLGINDPLQLAEATAIMRRRIVRSWLLKGVRCADPDSIWIGPRVELEEDIFIAPFVQLYGASRVEHGSRIGSFTVLRNSSVGSDTNIVGNVRMDDSSVGNKCSVGPFVFMRNNARLDDTALAGRYVEIKNSRVSSGAKVPHLSYIGDAEIGENTNIGAGTITCNYDGHDKSPTTIGSNCLIGSDTMIVAPVVIGNKVSTAAGSVITEDIPDEALGVGRARQKNITGWRSRLENAWKNKGGNK